MPGTTPGVMMNVTDTVPIFTELIVLTLERPLNKQVNYSVICAIVKKNRIPWGKDKELPNPDTVG